MSLRDYFRNFDRQKSWLAPGARARGDCVGGELAVERANRHDRIDCRIARHFGDLVRAKLRDRHLIGIDARFRQDAAEQRDVFLSSTDNANAMTCETIDPLDFRRWSLPGAFRRNTGG